MNATLLVIVMVTTKYIFCLGSIYQHLILSNYLKMNVFRKKLYDNNQEQIDLV